MAHERTVYLAKAKNGQYARADGTLTADARYAELFDTPQAIVAWFHGEDVETFQAVPMTAVPKEIR